MNYFLIDLLKDMVLLDVCYAGLQLIFKIDHNIFLSMTLYLNHVLLLSGVPQGSVIGPLSFPMYTAPLEDVINAHSLGRMIYADDTQVYIILDEAERSSLIPKIEKCISDIKLWSTANGLKLNDDKTKFSTLIHLALEICLLYHLYKSANP